MIVAKSPSGDMRSRYALPRFLSRKNTERTLVHLHEAPRNVNGGRGLLPNRNRERYKSQKGNLAVPPLRLSGFHVAAYDSRLLRYASHVLSNLHCSRRFSVRCKPGGVTLLSVYCNLAPRFYNQSVAMDRTVVTRSSDNGHEGSRRKAAQRIAFHDG
jgi:hypothetical protein